ncbi:hypothetical protein [Hymenobacter rubidus]|uniref:hypothetical protein n=1 Tax=Hymenobacter rubidus TaxID=1441626 RepID=UPI00191F8546|nr:hypothetical protein [Hymenobacter rubidus]
MVISRLIHLVIRPMVALLIVSTLGLLPAAGQKVASQKVWTTYHKAALVELAPKYKSYSMEYDLPSSDKGMLGNVLAKAAEHYLSTLSAVEPPVPWPTIDVSKPLKLQNLEFKKSGGDVVLKIFVAAPTFGIQSHLTNTFKDKDSGKSRTQYAYDLLFTAEHGYTLSDATTQTVLASYKGSQRGVRTSYFDSVKELDVYVRNKMQPDLVVQLFDEVVKRADFELGGNTWPARMTVNSVEGDLPSYQEINTATNEFIGALSATTPDLPKIQNLTTVWEKYLVQANWDDKKAEINRKIGLGLIENLCVAYLLLENYEGVREKAAMFENQNRSFFAKSLPAFDIAGSYSGPGEGSMPVIHHGSPSTFTTVHFRSDIGGRRKPIGN